jgi:SAM-dependent methyltransferase
MHETVRDFCERVKAEFPHHFVCAEILEVGSRDINGGVRDLFDDCTYIGTDVSEGPGVDMIGLAHMLAFPDGYFKTVVSTEMLEHDPHWEKSLRNMARMVAPGGMLLITCATTGRLKHGTADAEPSDNPAHAELGEHYKNLDTRDFAGAMDLNEFSFRFEENRENHDLYFVGIKK